MGAEAPHVLLIDPHEDTRTLYAMLLTEADHVVYGASDGRSGVLLAEHRLPDAIVTELVVPGIDGFDIRRRLDANPFTRHIPVIAVTGLARSDIPDRARQAGFSAVLAKPAELDAVLQAVRDAVSATPLDRRVRRRLRRSLLTLRKLGTHLKDDPTAQERIRTLIDRLQVAVLAFDDSGRYVAASPAVSSLTGYSRDQILSRSLFQAPLLNAPTNIAQQWDEFLSAQQCTVAGAVKDAAGGFVELQAAFVTVLPGLHAAAIAPITGDHVR